ncbi:MAG: endonuclease/exonuclease/phosphatase family protein [Bdellovibrionales bacterium]|nr:endonuclease/exonuclease/phosphatase family protein [Bdellovibrionales bacterium]
MKKVLFFLFVNFTFYIEGEIKFSHSNQDLCVQTLNTYGMFYSDNLEERHQQTLSFLRRHDCDIVLLQEVWQEEHYQNLKELSQDINMKSVYFRKPFDDKKSGLVGLFKGGVQTSDIFYFPPAVQSGLGLLSDVFKALDKGFGMAQVHSSWTPQDSLLVFNFHLNHISQMERVNQLLLYLRWILENSYLNQAIIAGGDFNFEPDSLEFRIIRSLFRFENPYEQIRKQPECTHLCEDGGYEVFNFLVGEGIRDYIFFRSSPQMSFNTQDVFAFPKHYNDTFLSDHFGLRAIFHLGDSFEKPLEVSAEAEAFKERIKAFKWNLQEVESFFLSGYDTSSMGFIQSLYEDLENPESNVVQYLKY